MITISPYLIAILLAWVVGQGVKYLIVVAKQRSFGHVRQLYLSGNMPSSHTAAMVSVMTLIGMRDGLESGLFGLAVLMTCIVMYDAIMVRRSSGEQGLALHALIKEQGSRVPLPRAAQGHTPVEVLVGALVGLFIGTVVFLATT